MNKFLKNIFIKLLNKEDLSAIDCERLVISIFEKEEIKIFNYQVFLLY